MTIINLPRFDRVGRNWSERQVLKWLPAGFLGPSNRNCLSTSLRPVDSGGGMAEGERRKNTQVGERRWPTIC
jgi:hypothetical protein